VIAAELGRRARGVWRVLRHGDPSPPPNTVEVPISELRDLIERSLAAADLPYRWANDASTRELEVARGAVDVALLVRRAEWEQVEAGVWPAR
jgi:hypothetical protein